MQFTDLNMSNKRVEALAKSAEEIKEVQNVDMSINNIVDVTPLKDCLNIVKLNICKNKIKSLACFTVEEAFPNLRWLDVSANKFAEWPAFKCPKLEYLDISYNKMDKVSEAWTTHEKMRVVKCIGNNFKNLAIFKNMPNLEELNMSNNNVAALSGWESLPKLRKLNLKRNKIEKIEEEGLPELPALEKLNLHANKLGDIDNVCRLFQFPLLVDINVMKNPVETNSTHFSLLIAEIVAKNTKIQRFCKVKITEQNKLEAVHLAKYRFDKAEKARLEKLKADAAAAGQE